MAFREKCYDNLDALQETSTSPLIRNDLIRDTGIRDSRPWKEFNSTKNKRICFASLLNRTAMESMNATIQRILSKTCGVSDIDYLFSKLRQRYLMQRKMKLHDLFRGAASAHKDVSLPPRKFPSAFSAFLTETPLIGFIPELKYRRKRGVLSQKMKDSGAVVGFSKKCAVFPTRNMR